MNFSRFVVLALLLSPLRAAEPFPGEKADFHGVALYSVPFGKDVAKVLVPANPAPGRPWVLAQSLYNPESAPVAYMTRTELELVKRGFHIVAFGLGNTFGAPDVVVKWDAVYRDMTEKYGLAKQTSLMGVSREGLPMARWAAANPGKVTALYLDKAVCDIKSWPGGKIGKGKGSPRDWASLLPLYHFNSEAEALAYDQNPVDLAPKLIAAKVAILYIAGETDDVVPYADNGARVEQQYKKLGGEFVLISHPGEGHHPHGLANPSPVVDFIVNHAGADPILAYLDGKTPEILRELPPVGAVPEGVMLRRVVFRSRDESEIFAVIAKPTAPGKYPGMLVLHGGGGSAEVDKAIAWAQRGYVAVAPDLPGIAEPKKLVDTKGKWSALKYGEGRWQANPDGSASMIFDAVLAAMKSLYLLRAQPEVDPSRIGVVGISWGGYMTTMVAGLAGDQVRAAFAVYGCGFYELTAQRDSTMAKMTEEDRVRWLRDLDAGRRAPGIKAAFFTAGAANDFFYWPRAVQATLDAIPGEKNHLYAPNANHKAPLPGGTVSPTKGTWLSMEVPYFEYHLKGLGQPLPKVTVQRNSDRLLARVNITSPRPLTKVEFYWARTNADVMKREWIAQPASKSGDNQYEAKLPAEAADWFAVASDDRPVTVSGDLISVGVAAAQANSWIKAETDRPGAIYKPGEKVVFRVSLAPNAPVNATELSWTLTLDGAKRLAQGIVSLKSGPVTVEGTLDRPGVLQFKATSGFANTLLGEAIAGAAFDPYRIEATAKLPADFEAFWKAQKAELAKVPLDPKLTPVSQPDPNLEVFELSLANINGLRVHGYLARPKSAKSLPALIALPGMGLHPDDFKKAVEYAKMGFLALDLSIHDLPMVRTAEDLKKWQTIVGYPYIGREDRMTYFYRQVFLGIVQAVNYLVSRPDWNRKSVISYGGSQGGGLALIAAALDPRITATVAIAPALGEHTGLLHDRPDAAPNRLRRARRFLCPRCVLALSDGPQSGLRVNLGGRGADG